MRARFWLAGATALAAVGCDRPSGDAANAKDTSVALASAAARDSVPAYLLPVFASLDTLLTDAQRDTLRALDPDSAFFFRTRTLGPVVEAMVPVWIRLPVGDTLIAHGERQPGMVASPVLLDLYQQHLRRQAIDLAGALHRISPDYVSNYRTTLTVDSVLLAADVDGSGGADRLVREARRSPDEEQPLFRRLALYLDPPASGAGKAAWTTEWDDISEETLTQTFPLSAGGTLLVIGTGAADADANEILLVRRGTIRLLLAHQIDSGEGDFTARAEGGRVVVTVSGDARVETRVVSPTIACASGEWPGSTITFESTDGRVLSVASVCLTRREAP